MRAQRMSQFIRESELEDFTKEPVWQEKARSEIVPDKDKPIFLQSFLFEAVNFERLIIKVCIFHISGKKRDLKLKRFDADKIDLRRHRLIGEQRFRIYDIVRNGKYETKVLENTNPKQKSVAKDLKERGTVINVRFSEIE